MENPTAREIRALLNQTSPASPVLLEVRPGVYVRCAARIINAQIEGDYYTEFQGPVEDAYPVGQCLAIEQF